MDHRRESIPRHILHRHHTVPLGLLNPQIQYPISGNCAVKQKIWGGHDLQTTRPRNHTHHHDVYVDMLRDPLRNYKRLLIIATIVTIAHSLHPGHPPEGFTYDPPLAHTLPHIPRGQRSDRPATAPYHREQFGGWATADVNTHPCTTRQRELSRALGPQSLDGCMLIRGEAADPYGNGRMGPDVNQAIEIDHIFPLSAAWDMGAYTWDHTTMRAFANDPLNLVAVSRTHNQDKGDKLPAEWMPPDRAVHCWYARRIALIAATYQLNLSNDDVSTMKRACIVQDALHATLG